MMACNRCGRPMVGSTAYDGACACGGLIRRLERDRQALIEVLKACCCSIEQEASCGGEDHPVIQAHLKTANKARALLAKMKK